METPTTNTNIKELMWQNIKDLPEENIQEILNFIIYTKNKTYKYEQSANQHYNTDVESANLFRKLIEQSEKDYKEHKITINEEFEKEAMLW